MRDLNDLVPPWELCRDIPNGCFADSALVWHGAYNPLTQSYLTVVTVRPPVTLKYYEEHPAPTLQELLIALPDWSELSVDFVNPQITLKLKKGMIKAAPAEVLKLWLKLKGIEDGE